MEAHDKVAAALERGGSKAKAWEHLTKRCTFFVALVAVGAALWRLSGSSL